ncbi:DUF1501 domain-containing protein [Flavobacterium sp.]|uniref:DUF1501 domain-containing protein n=1 Tax=Flavobacterium sp. TaxID=239 RepID=UPI002635493F|nr:DUF1501 domain-containing protein [Flavobacterium sp.]
MNRRNFLSLTGTFTGGVLVLPDFLHALGSQPLQNQKDSCIVFIQLNGGNDGLNTYIPFDHPGYYDLRPHIAIAKNDILGKNNGMGWHPALKNWNTIQQNGDLTVIQNVGYPSPNRSHFRSQEIWQTASGAQEYLTEGWLGRYLDLQCTTPQPTGGVNIDSIDNLALRGKEPNSITVKDPARFRSNTIGEATQLSSNPQLDFVRKIASSVVEGADDIRRALETSQTEVNYPATALGKNLEWIARLIKGNLYTHVYYTSQNGYDTHDNQKTVHQNKLKELDEAVFAFYTEIKRAGLLQQVTLVVLSEFGRRVRDNGNGTDHGTAAPVFVIGGHTTGKIVGTNPNLDDLDQGDLKFETDFRSVYATLLQQKLQHHPTAIGITQAPLSGIFR